MEFGIVVRNLLISHGIEASKLVNTGSHSLKVTTLSWLAKRGADKETRRALGYHAKADERTLEAYSRDSLAGPLRSLASAIGEISTGRFKPDETRSGQLVPAASSAIPISSSSSSCAPRSSSSVGSISDLDDKPRDEELLVLDKLVRNNKTKRFHIMLSGNTLACDRHLPVDCSIFTELPPTARMCSKCF